MSLNANAESWGDEDLEDPIPEPVTAPSSEEPDLAAMLSAMEVGGDVDPTLHTGELLVREAGKERDGECDVQPGTSFLALAIPAEVKKGIQDKGWHTMSKIQQIGLPLILRNPPANMLAQVRV